MNRKCVRHDHWNEGVISRQASQPRDEIQVRDQTKATELITTLSLNGQDGLARGDYILRQHDFGEVALLRRRVDRESPQARLLSSETKPLDRFPQLLTPLAGLRTSVMLHDHLAERVNNSRPAPVVLDQGAVGNLAPGSSVRGDQQFAEGCGDAG